ncbi:ubiquitin-protein ligase E3A isoform X2 [Culicoides brevitarsis]|uniref:ubiquitin-protein ligase E3A isoform X2 n=1 Tax=Culicoides brevitarsis TaxID=469753 RepID=UPI00307B9AAD
MSNDSQKKYPSSSTNYTSPYSDFTRSTTNKAGSVNDSDASCSSASSCSKSSHNSTTVDSAPAAISLGPTCLTEPILYSIIEVCQKETSYAFLIRTLGEVFSSRELIAQSFQKSSKSTLDAMLDKAPDDLKSMKKEDLRALENDPDKDEDCLASKEEPPQPHYTTVDLPSLKRSVKKLFEISLIFDPLNTALQNLGTSLSCEIRLLTKKEKIEEIITVFVIVFELIHNGASEFLEVALPSICCACAHLPIWAQARLACIWAEHCKEDLRQILINLQQLVTLQVIQVDYFGDYHIQSNEIVANATKVMKIVYYANMLAGEIEPPKYREDDPFDTHARSMHEDDDDDHTLSWNKAFKPSSSANMSQDPLAAELAVTILDCRKPYMPFEEFYNETLSDNVEMAHDYLNYTKNNMNQNSEPNSHFSFMLGYSFILTTATKTQGLFYGNRVRMFTERRLSEYQTIGHSHSPYLRLKVRRDHIIDDALVELEMFAMANPKDLKKQLKVEFAGEQGIDEGGVSKEFFQLIVEEIFNPDYGMFVHNLDSHNVWFNPTSFENEAQFTLIGIVLGLAIYNSIILPVNFPMVVYRKLMGMKGSFRDLEDFSPVLYRSLKSLLDYEENDMEDTFVQTFKITYQDVFGDTITHELKPDGDSIFVNQENKFEFVELYADFMLNKSIEKQFKAFKKGFQMVTDESPLHLLFRPDEIELLVCGSRDFDFNQLEETTVYVGYSENSQIIKDFWDIVHKLPIDLKRKLLQFTTGSDRVPVGGLSNVNLMINRSGPDSDRLPTSHTCYNVLLLPEYPSKEKLEDRLLKAINYSTGFGML